MRAGSGSLPPPLAFRYASSMYFHAASLMEMPRRLVIVVMRCARADAWRSSALRCFAHFDVAPSSRSSPRPLPYNHCRLAPVRVLDPRASHMQDEDDGFVAT